jgi:GNAT superfamily N-acetyltransferase
VSNHARGSEVLIRVGPEFSGDALGILREAAAWALARGVDVWTDAELREPDFQAAAESGQLVMGFSGARSAATMLLQSADPVCWPDAEPDTALYLHKIAVRREFAGHGWLTRLIEFAVNDARDRGVGSLRLDTLCRSPLEGLYARHGFAALNGPPILVEGRLLTRMQREL